MTSTYAVQVECSSGGDRDEDGNNAYDRVLAALDEKVVDSIVRDDGSAVFWLEWSPLGEFVSETKGKTTKDVEVEGGAATWQSAKASIENIKSTFAGYGVLVHELHVGEHEESTKPARRRKSSGDE